MTAMPFSFPIFKAFTTTGTMGPLSGGLLHTFEAGTSTPLAVYQDAALTAPHTNPVVLDSNGQATIYLGPNAYKIRLEDSTGAVQPGWPIDSIEDEAGNLRSDLASSSGSSLVGFLQSGTGAVARTVQDKGREWVSVKDFGAVGDGVTDDTDALLAAFLYCSLNNHDLLLGDGEYKHTSSLPMTGAFNIRGNGTRVSRLLPVGCDGIVVSAGLPKVSIAGLTIAQSVRYTTTPNAFTGIRISGTTANQSYWYTLRDLFIDGFLEGVYGGGLCSSTIDNLTTVYTHQSLLFAGQCLNNTLSNSRLGESDSVSTMTPTAGSFGVKVGDGVVNCEGCLITKTLIYGVETCVWNYGSINVVVDDCILDGVKKFGILQQSSATAGAINNIYASNYIGFYGASGDTGIYLANAYAAADAQNRGTVVRDNEILAYAGSTLAYGILQDGAEEERNLFSGNRVQNTTARDCKITTGSQHRVSDNLWRTAVGFETTVPVSYLNNVGATTAAYPSSIGTFTPTIIGTTAAGVGTYTTQVGSYKIVDKMVFFNVRLTWTAHTGTGDIKVSGLPVASKNIVGYAPATAVMYDNLTLPAGATNVSALINTAATTIELRGQGTGLVPTPVAMDGAASINISGFYEID